MHEDIAASGHPKACGVCEYAVSRGPARLGRDLQFYGAPAVQLTREGRGTLCGDYVSKVSLGRSADS